jgi:hypothetical protein
MTYDIVKVPLETLVGPLAKATVGFTSRFQLKR